MTKPPPITITEAERGRWKKHFACRTPDKIQLRPFAGGFECRGCSGCCGMSHFELEKKLIQPELI